MTQPTRDRLRDELDDLLRALASPLSQSERKVGWSRESAAAVATVLERARERLDDPRPIRGELPDDGQAVRALDAWGVDVMQSSELTDRVLDVMRGLGGVR